MSEVAMRYYTSCGQRLHAAARFCSAGKTATNASKIENSGRTRQGERHGVSSSGTADYNIIIRYTPAFDGEPGLAIAVKSRIGIVTPIRVNSATRLLSESELNNIRTHIDELDAEIRKLNSVIVQIQASAASFLTLPRSAKLLSKYGTVRNIKRKIGKLTEEMNAFSRKLALGAE